jgi:butyrate kinase
LSPARAGHRILVINTGSASTKLAVYNDENVVWSETLEHLPDELAPLTSPEEHLRFRTAAVEDCLAKHDEAPERLCAVVARGGALRSMPGGVYLIDERVVDDLLHRPALHHAANFSPPIAFNIARRLGIRAYLLDPITVDEFDPEARLSGLPQVPRQSRLHALSVRSTAHRVAQELGRDLQDLNMVVAHLGSGISIAAVRAGRMVDVNGADDEGPFSPERAGSICASVIVDMCFSGKYTEDQLIHRLTRASGLKAHLGTADARDVERMIQEGDEHALRVAEAMFYGIAKEIGAMAAVLSGNVDAVAITGGLAHWQRLVDYVTERCRFIAPVYVYPGENEMQALAMGALRVLNGLEEAKDYSAVVGGEPR